MSKKQQEQPIKAKTDQYEFLYTEGEPNSLVIFANIEEVIQSMFNKLNYLVIWISNFPDAQKVEFISTYLQVKIKCLNDPSSALQFLQDCSCQDKNNINRYLVICSYQLTHKQHQTLKKHRHLQLINYTPIHQLQQNPVDKNPEQIDFDVYVETQDELLQKIKVLTTQKIESKQFFNFHFIPCQNHIINNYVKIIDTMAKIPINLELRAKIVDKLEKLISRLTELDEEYRFFREEMKEFLGELRVGQLSQARVIFWYTSELPIYKLLNNFLRSYHNPSHIFYIQPFFKDLFLAILAQSAESLCWLSQKKKLTFYRGGTITANQFSNFKSNISQLIQSSSFLSTSTKQKVASDYQKNLKIEIQIQLTQIHFYENLFRHGIGFVFLGNNSYYSNQCQVLFSPSNLFKIIQTKNIHVGGGVDSYFVKLKHYCSQECTDEDNQNINQKFMCSPLKQRIRLYCGPFINNFGYNFKQSQLFVFSKIMYVYWNKHYQISNDLLNKKLGAISLAKIYFYYNNYQKAIQFLHIGFNIKLDEFPECRYNTTIQQQKLLYLKYKKCQIQNSQFEILQIMSNTLIKLRKYNQALFYIRTRKQKLDKLNKKGSLSLNIYDQIQLKIYFDEAVIRNQIGQYQKSIDLFVECKNILRKGNLNRITQFHFAVLYQIGTCYFNFHSLENAMSCFNKAQQIAQFQYGLRSIQAFQAISIITVVYITKGQLHLALKHISKIEDQFKSSPAYPRLKHRLIYIIGRLHYQLFEYEKSYVFLNSNYHTLTNDMKICHTLQWYLGTLLIIAHIECFAKGNVARSRSLIEKCLSILKRANKIQIVKYWAFVINLKCINDGYGYDKHSYSLLKTSINKNWKFCPAPKERKRLKKMMTELQYKMNKRKCNKKKICSFVDFCGTAD